MKNIRIFYMKIFPFLVVKFSIYLNRRVLRNEREKGSITRYAKLPMIFYSYTYLVIFFIVQGPVVQN